MTIVVWLLGGNFALICYVGRWL